MSFMEASEMEELADNLPLGLTVDHLLDLLKFVLIGGGILLAIRMLRPKAAPPVPAQEVIEGEMPFVPETPEMVALAQRAADGDEAALRDLELMRNPDGTLLDEEIALAEIDGRIKTSALKRIGDVIAAGPAESASVIRQWMNS